MGKRAIRVLIKVWIRYRCLHSNDDIMMIDDARGNKCVIGGWRDGRAGPSDGAATTGTPLIPTPLANKKEQKPRLVLLPIDLAR
jgi:hypothetical protein